MAPARRGPKSHGSRAELVQKLWDSLVVGKSTYEYFEYLGKFGAQTIPDYADPYLPEGHCFGLVDDDLQTQIKGQSGEYCYARSTKKHIDISVRKMDICVSHKFRDCPLFLQAVEIVDSKFGSAFDVREMTVEEIIQDTDLTKACGFFETWRGYRSKQDCIRAGLLAEFLDPSLMDEVVLWKVSGKNEIKDVASYIGEKKQRTFIIEPFSMLYHDKRIFGFQNKNMKNLWWSAYGMNPYEGGVTSLAHSIQSFRRYWEWDVKGYDRRFPHMSEVQHIRSHRLPDSDWKDWVVNNKVNSHLVLPSGDVIYKTWGNNSGSGTTTTDNIIGMAIILVHAILRMGFTRDDIDKFVYANLFGDDVLGGDSLPIPDDVFREGIESTFTMYGFELDPFIISHQVEGHTFLGFEIVKHGDWFIPKYKLDRLSYAFIHVDDDARGDPEKEVSKMFSLMLMSAGNGEYHYNLFRSALLQVLVRSTTSFSERYRKVREHMVPTYQAAIQWFVGCESQAVEYSTFFETLAEEGWYKNFLYYDV